MHYLSRIHNCSLLDFLNRSNRAILRVFPVFLPHQPVYVIFSLDLIVFLGGYSFLTMLVVRSAITVE